MADKQMMMVDRVSDLQVGLPVWIQERGEFVGPFDVVRLEGRTRDHVVLQSASNLFEQCLPVWVVGYFDYGTEEMCNCESDECGHPYMGVPAGTQRCQWIGRVCDDCASTHLSGYMVDEEA